MAGDVTPNPKKSSKRLPHANTAMIDLTSYLLDDQEPKKFSKNKVARKENTATGWFTVKRRVTVDDPKYASLVKEIHNKE